MTRIVPASQGELPGGTVFYQHIIDSLPSLVLILSPDLIIQAVSNAYLEATLTRREDLTGKYVFAIFPDNPATPQAHSVRNLKASLQQVLRTGKPHQMEIQHYDVPDPSSPGGFAQRYWSPLNTPIVDEKGVVSGIIHQVVNVTEQVKAQALLKESQASEKQSEAALRESEERFRLFVTASTDTLYKMSPDWKQMLHLEGMNFLEDTQDADLTWVEKYIPQSDQPQVWAAIREALQSKRTFELEHRVIRADGTIGWTYSRAVPVMNEKGEIIEWFGAASDITERKQVEAALVESEERFRTMADASGLLIAYTDEEGNAVYFNQEWLKYTGRSLEALVEYGWADFFHPEDRESFVEAYKQAFGQRRVLKREFRLKSRQGDYRWQLAVVSPHYRPDGTLAGYVSSSVDITELKQAEQKLHQLSEQLAGANEELLAANEEIRASNGELFEANTRLRQANEQLRQANEQLDRINTDLDNFVYAASHDLKAPIHNIEGLMQVLVRSLPTDCTESERVQESARMITHSIERFKRTISHLTEISKLQKEANQPPTSVSLAQVIEEVALDLQPLIESSNARIEVAVGECPQLEFSEKNLRSIIYNLMSNALKYRSLERAPVVRIGCHKQADYYLLQVEDNGLGLDLSEDKREKLFGMFKRLHTHVEGSGIGLYMVKKMVDNAGGRIEVESQLGKGTAFKVYFKR